jgi:DMSO/TMAO reductase YedYZ heme-binding membrane subunit
VPAHLLAAAVSTAGPSWYWYATRGLGVSTLIVLTGTVVIGIVTAVRWSGQTTPAFVAADMHRNLSLLAMLLLAGHIVTTVLDPFAHISVRDVIIPIGAAYRPVWLGFGVLATDILLAVIATSLLRERIGPRVWRWLHWAAYLSWPLAVVHGVGTGSDARAPWLIAVVVSCVVAVLLALIERIRHGPLITLPIRAAAAVAAAMFLFVAGTWAFSGPFQVGWAAKAGGAPPVKVAAAKPGPVHPGPGGFSDPLIGMMVRDAAGNTQISMRDTVDTALTIAIRSPNSTETLPTMAINRDKRVLCTVPATVSATLYAVCGTTRLTIAFYGSSSALDSGGQITGRLVTSGPLN